jgi:hypothetical protein
LKMRMCKDDERCDSRVEPVCERERLELWTAAPLCSEPSCMDNLKFQFKIIVDAKFHQKQSKWWQTVSID